MLTVKNNRATGYKRRVRVGREKFYFELLPWEEVEVTENQASALIREEPKRFVIIPPKESEVSDEDINLLFTEIEEQKKEITKLRRENTRLKKKEEG